MSAESLDKATTSEVVRDSERTTVDTSVRRIYRLIDDHIESVGGMDSAAGLCGVKRWDLRRALDRDGRYLPVDHVVAIAARMRRFNAGIATQIGAALVHPIDLLVFPRVQLDDKEENRRMKNMLRAMSVGAGVDLVSKALETP